MQEFTLEEESGHKIHYEVYGNPEGEAILSFHGGPGGRSQPSHAGRFDLEKYKVILFDQRGCGKSAPLGYIKNNTTQDILLDVERIRKELNISSWFVSGNSWGATLSLLYAIQNPEKVKGILISAVFLADKDSIAWAMQDPNGAARFLPDVWAKRLEFFKQYSITLETQNEDILEAFAAVDLAKQKEITVGIKNWEGNLASVEKPIIYVGPEDITETDIASAKIFSHFEMNYEFLPDNYILENIMTISTIPTVIVHGRYDINCPLGKAYALKEQINNCELIIIPLCGHKFTAEGEVIQRVAYENFLKKLNQVSY